MEPHVEIRTYRSDLADRVDRTGDRGASRRDHGYRCATVGEVPLDGGTQGRRVHPPMLVDRDAAQVGRPDPQDLDGALDARVRVGARVDGRSRVREPAVAALRERPRAGSHQPGQVALHAAAGEGAAVDREPDELAHPPQCLALHDVRRGRLCGEVRVVRVRQRLREHRGLETRRPDVAEVARTRVREALVEDLRRRVERRAYADPFARKRCVRDLQGCGADRRLSRTRLVEAVPRVAHEPETVLERLRPLVAEVARQPCHVGSHVRITRSAGPRTQGQGSGAGRVTSPDPSPPVCLASPHRTENRRPRSGMHPPLSSVE